MIVACPVTRCHEPSVCQASVPLSGMLAVRLAVLVQVRQPVELGKAVGVILVHDVDLHFAEAAREGHLARRRHVLRRKQQHLVAQERLVDRAEELVAHVVGERRRR